jgi:hypothetical protein
MTVAMASPARVLPRLGRMLPVAFGVRKRCAAGPENHTWYIRATIADGGGKNGLWCADAHSCQAAAPAMRTTHRQSQFSLSVMRCLPLASGAP